MGSQTADIRPALSPPPPAYVKSSPPPPPPPSHRSPPLPPVAQPSRHISRGSIHIVPPRKPIALATTDSHENAKMHHSPVSPVRIDDPSAGIPQASAAQIDDVRTLGTHFDTPQWQDRNQTLPKRQSSLGLPPNGQQQPQQPQYLPYRQPLSENRSASRTTTPPQQVNGNGQHAPGKMREDPAGSSRGSVESLPQEEQVYQPLQYHHQPFQEHLYNQVAHRGSKSTIRTNSDSSSAGEHLTTHNNHLAPGRRNASALSIPRPNSAYSELRGRTHSLQLAPGHARAVSSHSAASPDARPMSYIDLMNVPYPQPPPAPNAIGNAHLRSSVGNNASLLTHKQTFEMYLANVKKTNDSGAQYEFAVFMINAAQESRDDDGSNGDAKAQKDNRDIPRAQLLREAKAILQRLADRSYPYAQYYLANGLASGLFNKGKPDLEKSFQLFVAASKHGHAEAGYRAALCYEFGWGSSKDGAKAVQFFRQAASKNHPGAMARLGRACLAGDMGLVKRYREGIKWLKRAAESADVQYNAAPFELGLLHETGDGADVFQDESYAAQLFTRSAELGHPEANYRLGDAYEHGTLNCPRDPALSVHFYTGAATLGHPLAMMALCAWFMVGAEPILDKDEYEAYEWAMRAALCGKCFDI